MDIYLIMGGIVGVLLTGTLFWTLSLRRVVPPNEVHIIQRAKKTISHGKGMDAGNVYYQFPVWVPILGITVNELPVSVFSLDINNYEAYDKDRLPFTVDIKAFFRITDSYKAAERLYSYQELTTQLLGITQGAVRSILAKENLESIMEERNVYGEKFTEEIKKQLDKLEYAGK